VCSFVNYVLRSVLCIHQWIVYKLSFSVSFTIVVLVYLVKCYVLKSFFFCKRLRSQIGVFMGIYGNFVVVFMSKQSAGYFCYCTHFQIVSRDLTTALKTHETDWCVYRLLLSYHLIIYTTHIHLHTHTHSMPNSLDWCWRYVLLRVLIQHQVYSNESLMIALQANLCPDLRMCRSYVW
jgi:hypothetical protein